MRTTLAVQEALLRSIRSGAADQATLAAAGQAAAEEAVLSNQVQRGLTADAVARFTAATASAIDRRAVLQSSLASDRRAELSALLLPIATESAGLGDLVAETFAGQSNMISAQTDDTRSRALRDTALVIGALLAALAIALLMARSVVSPVRRLHAAALDAAHRRLPETIERVRAGEQVPPVEPVGIATGEEIGQLAHAFDDMQRQAVRLAGEQAELRKQVSEMFMTLARRSQSMVELQLTVLEGLESDERDPRRLDELFRLDHLATRLRRNGENLQVLAGGTPVRHDTGPVSMVELLRGATSEVKDYRRVSLVNVPNGAVRAQSAADVVHMLAELLENATRFSPPEEKVYLTADRGADGGLLVEVVDNGLGMTTEDLETANHRLAAGDTVGPETTRRMGLFVVGRLASLHGVTVRLRPTMTRAGRTGVTASVHLPRELIIAEGSPVNGSRVPPRPAVVPAQGPTPIFDRVVSNWFTEHSGDEPAELAPASRNWVTPADDARRAAESAVHAPASTALSPAGLPTRKPGAQLAPGAALPRPARAQAGFRDPAAVRNNLSRHYNGMRAARQRTANEERS
ncbi:sensor histidine kinase [Amycolatopsis alkalitolerans]|uniref:sensor histidine kinase n=1 Tax=Amycolatopsis alkalitolerans TaxID=2547244 RepID=UPI001F19AF00|nr:ATP-binding protein [Amycolatopsis alkalitolerans]